MQRIEAFLNEPEVPDWASTLKSESKPRTEPPPEQVGFEGATFEWDIAPKDEPSRFTLGPLDVVFPKGRLALVRGATGSGKSALLNALLGGSSFSLTIAALGHFVLMCRDRDALHCRTCLAG